MTSPYELDGLRPDTSYSIYAIAYTPEGKSLKSTVVQFSTGEHCKFYERGWDLGLGRGPSQEDPFWDGYDVDLGRVI